MGAASAPAASADSVLAVVAFFAVPPAFAVVDFAVVDFGAFAAGLTAPDISTYEGVYGAPSVAAAVRTEIDSTPLGERISADVYRRILDDADAVLAPFTQTDGALRAPFSADVVVARRP